MAYSLLRFKGRYVNTIHQYFAFTQGQHAKYGFHRGRFTGTVRAYHNGDFTLVNADGAVMQDIGATVAPSHVLANEKTH